MGTQGSGRKRIANRERLSAEDDTLNLIAREAEARLAAKRAARAEAREIRMKELERQQKEIYQVQKKYYGLDTKWGDIEQWMEDSEKYSRRFRRHTSVSDEDDWTSVGSRGSARPSEYNCVLGSSSRTSSRASSARASPVVEEKLDKDFIEKGSRAASSLSAATLASLGGTSSRRGSGETTTSIDTEGSIREIKEIFELKDQIQDVEGKYMEGLKELKDSLMEVEEKYKKAMVSNAQLDNEKANLMYQVDTLREDLLGLEEQLAEMHRGHEEKSKELERQKHAYCILQHQFEEMKETLQEREEMLTAHGLMTNGEAEHVGKEGSAHRETAQTRPQAEAQQQSSSDKPLDFRVNTFIDEKEALLEQIKKLKAQLDEKTKIGMTEKAANSDTILENGMEVQVIDVQSEFSFKGDANRQISDYKFKLTKTEQEITALEQNIIRLESQVLRYKTAAENAEKVEDELKAEKRKLQREVRSALDKIEELEMSNTHLSKRLEKMKANRSALLSQQ
ncbi:leucine-rich repeat flightless-interacting protein 2-like isoform X13 [Leucoraja erinacea]|uniref:leucine-rich repeat flightless-interacting protein 2-like isoform X13 n=1 Tax=Leucoraja erinaceus TaxID=7782 RepID=UPI002454FE55|nr:leucine-rich repeat flightless-interacting protein 2-like isoform X13 [Leucoraja erinacea]